MQSLFEPLKKMSPLRVKRDGNMGLFRKIWAIYGIVVFFGLWLAFSPLYLIAFLTFPRPWYRQIIWFSHHIYTRCFFGLTLIRIKVEGRKKLSRRENYIIVSNHRSTIDFMINAYAFPGVYKFLAKKELARVPLFGMIVKRLCVLVDRSSAASRRKSIQYLKRTLDEGFSVFIYPEGTRNTSGEPLGTFFKGAFRIAIETQTPIAIQTIIGIDRVCGRGSTLDLSPGAVTVKWAAPVPTEGLTMKDLPDLMARVRQIMTEQIQSA
ncbi:MAG: 1-acyl-sn-glycerol-3-phosphate acyltransferase [Bacteroidetes bacterium]|nr:MAG: 1-acyl-sn-glycerol-3-phosphate acyltransferase [Bacteroidota bacterium]